MYSYSPGFVIVTEADSPGLINLVLHEPSRAFIVWETLLVFVNVTLIPAVIFARLGAKP